MVHKGLVTYRTLWHTVGMLHKDPLMGDPLIPTINLFLLTCHKHAMSENDKLGN